MITLEGLGWDESFQLAFRRTADGEPARVTTVDHGLYGLLTASGPARAGLGGGLLSAASTDRRRLPCAGDWVVLRTWPDDRATIEAVLPRRTTMVCATPVASAAAGPMRMANLDTLAVVVPATPEPDQVAVQRLLDQARDAGIPAVVVLTKVDLIDRPMRTVSWEVPRFEVSARRGDGIQRLRQLAGPGRTLGLIGGSGSGKSAIVNALAGAIVMPTHTVRRVDRRGRQSTTRQVLVPLPGGGAVVDTPGVTAVAAGGTARQAR